MSESPHDLSERPRLAAKLGFLGVDLAGALAALPLIAIALITSVLALSWGGGTLLVALGVAALALAQVFRLGFELRRWRQAATPLADSLNEQSGGPNSSFQQSPRDVGPPLADEIVTHAARVLGSRDAALDWLKTPAIGLNNIVPADLVGTESGRKAVIAYLDRIDYGVYT